MTGNWPGNSARRRRYQCCRGILFALLLVPGLTARGELPALALWTQAGGECKAVAVQSKYAYAGFGWTFMVMDLTDPLNPTQVGSLVLEDSIEDIVLNGSLAYVACDAVGVSIVDITNPAHPRLRGSCDTPGSATQLAVAGSCLLVADGEAGLRVIDVSAPDHPLLRGAYPAGGFTSAVSASGTLACIGSFSGQFEVVSFANPNSPTRVGGCSGLSAPWRFTAVGDRVYIADYNNGMLTANVSTPSNPSLMVSYNRIASYDVAVSGTLVFLSSPRLEALDMTDPAHPRLVATYGGTGTRIALYRDFAVGAAGFVGLYVTDVSALTGFKMLGRQYAPNVCEDAVLSGSLLCIAYGTGGVRLYDVSTPTSPVLMATYDTPGTAKAVAVSGDLLCVADSSSLQILDLSTTSSPVFKGSLNITATDVVVSGTLAFLAGGGVWIADISNPAAPLSLGSCPISYVDRIELSGNCLYATEFYSMHIIDVRSTTSPVVLSTYELSHSPEVVAVSGHYAYLPQNPAGIVVLDVSDPTSPTLAGRYWSSDEIRSLSISGNTLFVGPGVYALDISNPATPVRRSQVDTVEDANNVVAFGNVLVCLETGWNGFSLYDIGGFSLPFRTGGIRGAGCATAVECSNSTLYIADEAYRRIDSVDISNPQSPHLTNSLAINQPVSLELGGRYLYVVDRYVGVKVLDVSDPGSPAACGRFDDYWAGDVILSGSLLCVSDANPFTLVDVSTPTSPTAFGASRASGDASRESLRDYNCLSNRTLVPDSDMLCWADNYYEYYWDLWHARLELMDISDPSHPALIREYVSLFYPIWSVAGSGDLVAAVYDGLYGAQLYSRSGERDHCDSSFQVTALAMDWPLLYLADDAGHIDVYDLTGPWPVRTISTTIPVVPVSMKAKGDLLLISADREGAIVYRYYGTPPESASAHEDWSLYE